jgi:hypothetical protein
MKENHMTITVVCEHERSVNPRMRGKCYKCGQDLPDEMFRDPARELELLERHTEHKGLAQYALSHVQARAGVDRPWGGLAHRDFKQEALEEIVDLIAYLSGRADQRALHGHETSLGVGESMALYHALEALRCLMLGDDD